MEKTRQNPFDEELERLEETSGIIDEQLAKLRAIPRYFGQDLTEQALDVRREQQQFTLAVAANEPYFGRLDFQETGKSETQPLYIGKAGVENPKSNDPLVIDWRAPIASLFYSFTGGELPASYESPEGIIDGLVYLKRNLVIRKQALQRVVDTYERGSDLLPVADEFLLYRLGENKDNRLRDIVSTIQAEQDQIIRAAKNSALVIQGVAGSGKTTVALHRLAYLLYQYRENVKAENMIIFAPNSMFLDYISGVLPELGVGNIQQTTFADWALELLEHEGKLADPSAALRRWFAVGKERPALDDHAPGRFKGSIAFLRMIEAWFDAYEQTYVPHAEFEPWEGCKLASARIREWFYVEYKHYPLLKRRERTVARIERWLGMELDKIGDPKRRKEQKKKAGQRLKTFLKSWQSPTPLTLYKQLFEQAASSGAAAQEHDAGDTCGQPLRIPPEVIAATEPAWKKKEVQPEDLPPLLLIRSRLSGTEGGMFDHVVVDEAQDFSPFQIALLSRQTRGGSFTILGDLAQGIHAYQGIWSWDEFLSLFDSGQSGYFQLERSYRSTMEIIHFANAVLSRSGETLPLAVPVFRSGDKVSVTCVAPKDRDRELVAALERELAEGSANTVAVIGRTEESCAALQKLLEASGIAATLIDARQREYKGGVSVLPAYLAKGLEFDAVLIADADDRHYEASARDAKLLYVACTRALHRLSLFYTGTPSPLLGTVQDL
ncbi:HelD family protein [Paenibacillus sp. MBLB4367]|uniref:HelD family protein n=1 Tax=Paenibacillus sp. MBLB4367 TaxID=3384767 RepID=UPI00390832F3